MHPDQRTPDTHRYHSADSNRRASGTGALDDRHPENDQHADAIDRAITEGSDAPGAAPDVDDGARIAEAGNAYTGRTLDDDLKAHPRVNEPGDGTAE